MNISAVQDGAALCFGRYEILPTTRQLLADGVPVKLGARAFDVLAALIERHERVVSKDELLDVVWPGLVVEENNLQVHISALRKLLGPQAITTIPGLGYQFTATHNFDANNAIQAATSTSSAIPHNLPSQRTHFIGREAALAECARLLKDVRLLTLTGIGGCGKTRLALRLAQQQRADFADGVWFVDLAPLQDAQRVALAVASAVGVREEAGTPLIDRLTASLATRRMLIVLDNCEHVIAATAELVDALLARCAGLTIVATSREGLGVAGEQVVSVRPLSLPAAGADREAIQDSEAVRLFVDRARLVLPEFAVDEQGAPAIAEICRRLDGIALAIELAAARVKMLAVEEIRARLDDRFRLLTGGSRTLPRHQTLQATLQWSHDSLTPQEQKLFRQLAVFAGGCTLAAATQVADTTDDYAVLELLTHLHDKSLLEVDRDGSAQPRYRMLETVRQYARERLEEAGDGDAVRDRHLRCYVALAEEAEPQIFGPQQGAWMVRLALEQENLLAAHTWCERAPGGGEAGLRLIAGLWRYWSASAQLERGYQLAHAALAQAEDQFDARLRCRALWAMGWMAHYMGRYDEQLKYAERSLALARAIGSAEQTVSALNMRGGAFLGTGQLSRALVDFEEACGIARTLGVSNRLSASLNNLGDINRSLGNLAAAGIHYEESIGVARALQYPGGIAVPACNLARLLIAAGKYERAQSLLRESLAISAAAELKGMGVHLLEVSAGLAAALGDHSSAARFNGAALARMRERGSEREPVDQAFIAPLIARAQTALGTAAFEAAEAAGQALSYDMAMAEIKEWLERARDDESAVRPHRSAVQ